MRRRRATALMISLPLLAVATAQGAAHPSPDARLERTATSGVTPKAMRAERLLRRMEIAVLGPEHAAEHAGVRKAIRRQRSGDLRRHRLGLPPLRPRRPARALALGDPAQVGRWSAPVAVPVVGVHASLLPTGKILLIQNQNNTGIGYLLDPVTGAGRRVDPPGNLFCSGQTFLADGRYIGVGGQLKSNADFTVFWGLNQISVFDPWTEAWTRQADMRHGRWYPTATRLADGRVLITSGWDESGTSTMNPDVEIYTPDGATGSVSVVASRTTNFYPHWFVMPDGRALMAGAGRFDTAIFDPATSGFTETPRLNEARTGYGSGVLLPGSPSGSTRVMLLGGGATATTEVFDAANPSAGYSYGPPLPQARRNVNTVLLPDGSMLVVGGNSSGNEALPQREALLWTPGDTAFTPMASQSEQRAYHSTALLLPDGRVWSGGDNTASGGGNNGDAYELFEPPYLFRGARPTIAAAPSTLAYGERFDIAASVDATRAVLIAPGAATHGNDMNQRHIELAVTRTADGLSAVAPPAPGVAPPGYHMLFVLNADGVPSVASWVRVGGTTAPPPPPPPGNGIPLASFTVSPSSPLPGEEITLSDTSTDDGAITARAWDLDDDGAFDDGTGTTATVTFPEAGPRTVRLRVTDDAGATATASTTIDVGVPPPPPPVNTPPAASFTVSPSSAATGQAVTFTDTSTDAEGPVATRAWDLDDDGAFDDGTGTTATRTFAAAGTFTVRLQVTDGSGVAAATSRTVTVTSPAVNLLQNPSFETSLTGWSGFQANLTREQVSGAPDGAWVARTTRSTGTSFTIDDGNRSATPAVAGRTYTASAWVRAATASSAGKPVTVKVRERTAGGTQVADVSSAPVALTTSWQRVTMTRVAAGTGNSIGMRVSQANAVAGDAFQVDGASLTDGSGSPPPPPPPPANTAPAAAFTVSPSSPSTGQSVTFTDTSTDAEGPIAGRAWDLDDDGAFDDGTGATATRTFAVAGTANVRLRVTDTGGLQSVATRTVTVSATPPPPPPPPAGNLLGNPSFETTLTPWGGFQATVSRESVSGAPDGAWVARVAWTTGTSFTIDDGNRQFTSAVAGRAYTASAWVRAATASSVGKPVTVKLRERTAGGTQVADVSSASVALTTSWQRVQVTRTAAGTGNTLGVRVSQASSGSGNVIQVDAVALTSG